MTALTNETAFLASQVRRFRWATWGAGPLEMADLMQTARIGLEKARRAFDPARGPFGLFAAVIVRQHLRVVVRGAGPVRAPAIALAQRAADPSDTPAAAPASTPAALPAALTRALEALPARDAWVVRQRYLAGRTQASVAAEIGVTRQRVAALEARGLARLRAVMADAEAM